MGRKDILLRNLGGTVSAEKTEDCDIPPESASRVSVIMVERLLKRILVTECLRLTADTTESEAEATRYFAHFFDPIIGAEERAEFVTRFRRRPPKIVLGYPKTSVEFPCISIVLNSDDESQNLLADYMGITNDADPSNSEAHEAQGAWFDAGHMVYIYSEHPDETAFLYHWTKLTLFGAKQTMLQCGIEDVRFSGGELAPDEGYTPEYAFVRWVSVKTTSKATVPRLLDSDPRRLSITGVFMNDVVVDGIRGGVTPYDGTEDGDGES